MQKSLGCALYVWCALSVGKYGTWIFTNPVLTALTTLHTKCIIKGFIHPSVCDMKVKWCIDLSTSTVSELDSCPQWDRLSVIATQHSHITLWPLSPILLYSYTNPGINFIYHGPVTCMCHVVTYLQCSNISSSVHTSQRTKAHKSRCESLTHTKGMISNMLGIKSKSQGHFQYKLLFNCLVSVLCGPKMKSQHYFLLSYWYEWNGHLSKTISIIQCTVLNTSNLPTEKIPLADLHS